MKRLFLHAPLALALAACSSAAGDTGYQPGALGNGGFYFSCDDAAVSCANYSNDATKFPKAVSLGSSFAVRFVPNATGLDIHLNPGAPDQGITIAPVADFVTIGPKGLVAVKPGYATLASRDAAGQVVDYVVISVIKPDALVVFDDGESSKTSPMVLDTVTMPKGGTKVVRAFAQSKKQNLAGSLQVEWKSSDNTIVDVQSIVDGKATLIAFGSGNATLTATGGTFTQTVPVVVMP